MHVFFATSNSAKLTTPRRIFAEYGIELTQANPAAISGMPEPQGVGVAEVAMAKLRWAHQRLNAPVFVADSSFVIDALNGFPGIYVKHVTDTIGVDGYLRLLLPAASYPDRTCRFIDTIAYMDFMCPQGIAFTREEIGTLANEARGPRSLHQKSEVWKLFIPQGETKTVAELHDARELERYRASADHERHYRQLASWLKDTRQT